jgi:hypothetical protein
MAAARVLESAPHSRAAAFRSRDVGGRPNCNGYASAQMRASRCLRARTREFRDAVSRRSPGARHNCHEFGALRGAHAALLQLQMTALLPCFFVSRRSASCATGPLSRFCCEGRATGVAREPRLRSTSTLVSLGSLFGRPVGIVSLARHSVTRGRGTVGANRQRRGTARIQRDDRVHRTMLIG